MREFRGPLFYADMTSGDAGWICSDCGNVECECPPVEDLEEDGR